VGQVNNQVNETINISGFVNTSLNNLSFGQVNVTAFQMNITDCSSGSVSRTPALQFLVRDEQTQADLNDSFIQFQPNVSVNFSTFQRNYSFSFNLSARNNQTMCLYPQWETLLVQGLATYNRSNYTQRSAYYNLNISNSSQNSILYLLSSGASSQVIITVVDAGATTQPNITVRIQRFIVGNNSFIEVASFVSDFEGKGATYLEANDAFYRFLLYYSNGTLASLTGNTQIVCTAGTCPPYRLTLSIANVIEADFFRRIGTATGGCALNETSGVLTCTGSHSSGSTQAFTLLVDRFGAINYTRVCTNSALAASATLICPLGNLTGNLYQYRFYVNNSAGEIQIFDQGLLDFRTGFFNYGTNGGIYAFLLILTLAFVGGTPVEILGLGSLGILLSFALGFLSLSWTALVGILTVAGVLIWKMRT
jgi:hypothetical protein